MTALARPLLFIATVSAATLLFPALLFPATSADSGKRAVEQATELWKSGDTDAAIAFLHKSLESSPSAEAYHLLGQMYFKAKKKPREVTVQIK